MASISDNTTALQDILTAVQNLPEGGGGGIAFTAVALIDDGINAAAVLSMKLSGTFELE